MKIKEEKAPPAPRGQADQGTLRVLEQNGQAPYQFSGGSSVEEIIRLAGMLHKGELVPGSGVFLVEHPAYPGKTMAVRKRDFTTSAALRQRMYGKLKELGISP